MNIDNVSVNLLVPAATPTVNHSATFTEGGAAVTIANNPSIVDDAVQMVSARIVLTNAQAGDNLNVGNLPAGIDEPVTTVMARSS